MKHSIITIILVILATGITYIFVPRPYQVHHHANFAVYIDWLRVDFSTDNYMEETSRCNVTEDVKPQDRIHLHENKWWLVHVHMAASTWWDLFANLRWWIGKWYIVEPFGEIYTASGEKNLHFFINGEYIENPANEVVESTDRLLVWYGTGSREEVQSRSASLVDNDADEYNHKADPASCGSNTYGFLSPIAEPIHEWIEHSHDE